jgi:hypothetical protein
MHGRRPRPRHHPQVRERDGGGVAADPAEAEQARQSNPRAFVGSASEIQALVQQYIDAGVDELVVPIFSLRPGSDIERASATADRFITEVAPAFR